nr:RNA-directed DNA polymerase, eukaryota [Tanacetum cinerariifolium]
VAEKLQHSVDTSFRRPVRGGSESAQLESLCELIEGVILSNSCDRWFWDMNGSGSYRFKDVRNMLDDFFLPKDEVATRWLPHLSIKLNVFAWRLYLDRLLTKSNLIRSGIQVGSPICPNCISYDEDVSYIFSSVLWRLKSLGLFVVGGMWCGCLVALTPSGFLGCCRLK